MCDVRGQAAAAIGTPHVGISGVSSDRLKGQRRDELLRGVGQNHINRCARLHQFAGEIGALVTGDAARHTEEDSFAVEDTDSF